MPSVKHAKTSTIPDGADSTLVRPSDWNAEHVLVGDFGTASPPPDAASSDDYRDDGPPMPSPAVVSVVRELSGGKIVRDVRELVVDDNSLTDVGGNAVRLRGLSSGTIGCVVHSTGGTLPSTGSYQPVPYGGSDFDTDGFHSNVTNNSRITIPAGLAGKYLAIATFYSAGHSYYMTFRTNGSSVWSMYSGSATSQDANSTSGVFALSAGDYIEVVVNSNSTTVSSSYFQLIKLDSGRVGTGVGTRVYRSTSQTGITTATAIAFDSTSWQTDPFHDNVTNNTRLTIPAGMSGVYALQLQLWADNLGLATNYVHARVNVNGSEVTGDRRSNNSSINIVATFAWILKVAAGDYIEVTVESDDASFDLHASGVEYPAMTLVRLDSLPTGFAHGSTNPTGAATNDRFYRDDLGLAIHFDGSDWFTDVLYERNLNETSELGTAPYSGSGGRYFFATNSQYTEKWDRWTVTFYVATTNDASHYWNFVLAVNGLPGGSVSGTVTGTQTTQSLSHDAFLQVTQTLGGKVLLGMAQVTFTKVSTPGPVYPTATLYYRLVAT